ncbi:MAG TPA: HWE histidine kinase domain-containing protein [Sphingobium sp.]|nr:HWE histidine kinase domain-containing protein [Sphingobium sp.]
MMSDCFDNAVPLAHSHERLQAIVASAMDAIITIDDQHRIICFNPAAERMFRISAAEALGSPLERFIPHRFRTDHDEHIRRFGDTGETSRRMGALGAVSALRADGEEFPVEASISQALAGSERLSTVIMRDITERQAGMKAQTLLAREVDHRAKNILAIVSSLISLTRAPTREAYVNSLMGRIAAMSRAHGLLAQQRWKGAALHRVVRDELEAHADPARFCCTGPDLDLSSRAVQPLAMLFHELATNAVKYGALSAPEGRITLEWEHLPSGHVVLHWRERGGPAVTPPREFGFGSTLVRQIVENQLSGSLDSRWPKEGHELTIRLPDTVLRNRQQARPKAAPAESRMTSAAEPAPPADDTTADPSGTLLIVEDEPLLAMQLSHALKDHGWSILGVAGSVEDANRLLDGKARPDAAILDVDLGGAPVFPLARSLRRLGVPFIFCTGYEDLDYSSEFATHTTVHKPATVLQIVRALRDVVRNANAPSMATSAV